MIVERAGAKAPSLVFLPLPLIPGEGGQGIGLRISRGRHEGGGWEKMHRGSGVGLGENKKGAFQPLLNACNVTSIISGCHL